jgi:hypothetical protein
MTEVGARAGARTAKEDERGRAALEVAGVSCLMNWSAELNCGMPRCTGVGEAKSFGDAAGLYWGEA